MKVRHAKYPSSAEAKRGHLGFFTLLEEQVIGHIGSGDIDIDTGDRDKARRCILLE